MKKVTKKTNQKYVTEKSFKKFESSFEIDMANIAKSFARVDESLELHNKAMHEMLKEIKTIHEDNKYFRQSISNLYSDGLSHDRKISALDGRVEKLEAKSK